MSGPWPEELVAVAMVLRPQGNRGEVKAVPLTGRSERFAELRRVTAWRKGEAKELILKAWRTWRQFVILGFDGIDGIESAETLRGAMICVPREERGVLPPGHYYHDDLLGLAVQTAEGEPLGRLAEILETGASDVFVVRAEDGRETLVPALAAVVARIDLEAGLMVVDLPEGLV